MMFHNLILLGTVMEDCIDAVTYNFFKCVFMFPVLQIYAL